MMRKTRRTCSTVRRIIGPYGNGFLAERVGFEPTVRFPVRSLSRRVLSTAQSPLPSWCRFNRSRALRFSAIKCSQPVTKSCTAWTKFLKRSRRQSAAFGEEGLEDGGAVGGEDAGGDLYLMVETRVGEDFETGADGAAFGVVGAVNEARDASLDDGAGAHAAGLDGDVERSICKAVVAEKAGGFAKNNNLGVSAGVAVPNGAVVRTGKDLANVDEHGTDGDFADCGSGARFSERFLHELDVSFHIERENNTRKEGND